ncbi:MAG: tRNA (N(6)-L-threonylcarbamoyladenosine(37)-C(2))-methylthiotransferase MtaB [Lachnospirales bacterium]
MEKENKKNQVVKVIGSHTLGCKVNSYDTEAMIKIFTDNGYSESNNSDFFDVFIINTCSVTNLSEKKSRQIIRRVREKNKDAIIVVAGCYSQVAPQEIEKLEGINIIIGTKNRSEIYNLVSNYSLSMGLVNTVSDIMKERDFEPLKVDEFKNMTRAYLKIQEGCNQYCTYCIIPYARGNIRSRKEEDVILEVERLARSGVKEVVLAGIHIASYGKDLKNTNLLEIIKKVHEVKGIERIRFSSVEPNLMTEDFVSQIAKLSKVCDYFHLSLQSGCDKTLKQMNRKYTTKEYLNSLEIIRKHYENPSISTDVIVGFSGETNDDFKKSYEFCKKAKFSKIHVFPYSAKKGTKAYDFGDKVPKKEKDSRALLLRSLSDEMTEEYNLKFIDKTLTVLVEKAVDGESFGHSRNYIEVCMNGEYTRGDIVSVNCKKSIDGKLFS